MRYITNRSSGKMGYAIAEAAHARGAHVTLISGPTAIQPPKGVDLSAHRHDARATTTRFSGHADADVVIQAAAPADYRAREISPTKIKRTGDSLMIELVPNPDIAAALGARRAPRPDAGWLRRRNQ